jgi:signal transduction histidine kinase
MQNVTMDEFILLAPQMAHSIRDELSIMQTAADYLINDKTIPVEARDKIALLKGHLGNIAGLARQFLMVTGNELNQLTVLDVGKVISQLASLLQRLVGERNQLQIVIDPDLWPIKADLNQFEHLFCSLTANARDAMPNGGHLRISATNITKAECATKPEIRKTPLITSSSRSPIQASALVRIVLIVFSNYFLPQKVPVVALGWRRSTARSRKSTAISWSSPKLARERYSASTYPGMCQLW